MAAGKRYYWLKLKDDFFGSKRIKKLRKMAGGDTYLIIYLKLQLLAMKSEGVLTWTGLEQNIADELALDLDEEPDNVKITLSYLLSCGLAESSDDVNFFFPYSVENTGSESSSAQRMRNATQITFHCGRSSSTIYIKFDPMNPAPPVIRIVINFISLKLNFSLSQRRKILIFFTEYNIAYIRPFNSNR